MIKTVNLSYSYSGNPTPANVLKDINLTINEGEFVAVLGHNGSGKSTLAKLLNAILLPTEGHVYVNGLDTKDPTNTLNIRRMVGMVFQNPDNQIIATVVEEDVAFGPENLGVPPAEIRRRVDEALKAVGMYEHRHAAPHLLSGGQKQRVAIAGVLAMLPSCIVLDEATAMLDPEGRREVMAAVKTLNETQNITVVFITHFMDEAAQAKRVLVMDEGRIIMDGTPKEVLTDTGRLKRARLDVPQVTELMQGLKADGAHVRGDIIDVEECAQELMRVILEARCD